jgi:hypothetical protein
LSAFSSSKPDPSWTSLLLGTKDQTWFQNFLSSSGFSGTLATILSFLLYYVYLKIVQKDPRTLWAFLKDNSANILSKIPGLSKVPFLSSFISGEVSKIHVPKATQAALDSIAGTSEGWLSKLNPLKWNIFNPKKTAREDDDEPYQAGETYADPKAVSTTLAQDLKAVGLKAGAADLQTLVELVKGTGKPVDDRKMMVRFKTPQEKEKFSIHGLKFRRWRRSSLLFHPCHETRNPERR